MTVISGVTFSYVLAAALLSRLGVPVFSETIADDQIDFL